MKIAKDYVVIDYIVAFDYITHMKQVTYQPKARRTLRKIPVNTAKRIMTKVQAYADDPASQANNVKALKGEDAIRLRVGDWRVFMVETEVIDVIKIASRGDAY